VITITPSAATTASAIVFSPDEKSRNHVRYSGKLCFPTTLSRIILSGHGAAMLINVSRSIAIKMIAKVVRYGATSLKTKPAMFFTRMDPSIGDAVPMESIFGDLII